MAGLEYRPVSLLDHVQLPKHERERHPQLVAGASCAGACVTDGS